MKAKQETIKISSKESIYDLSKKYPQIVDIMAEAGFSDILKPMMLQTAGRYMDLEKGARVKNINWESIENSFIGHDFEIDRG
jgi:hypothetical protein